MYHPFLVAGSSAATTEPTEEPWYLMMVSKLLYTALPGAHIHSDTFSLYLSFYRCDICHVRTTSQSSLSSSFRTESWFLSEAAISLKDVPRPLYGSKLSYHVARGNGSKGQCCLLLPPPPVLQTLTPPLVSSELWEGLQVYLYG